jgi:hypothetical protein
VKTIIKLVIAIVIANAAIRVGLVAAKYYQLKDQTQELLTFSANATPNELQNQLIAKAEALGVPIVPDDITVTRDGLRTVANIAYSQSVEVFPNYKYPIKFQFTADAISMGGLGANQGGAPVAK